MKRPIVAIPAALASAVAGAALLVAGPLAETEPNNTPAQANPLSAYQVMTGTISPAGDMDYFSIAGINTTWGFIALLDTAPGTHAILDALAHDGSTVLQSDGGSWERGPGIALQNYGTNDSTDHYLRVSEQGNDAAIPAYQLRYYETVVDPRPETEPNETRAAADPSSFTMAGTIASASDVDCFAFHGRAGDTILLALKAPGSSLDAILELVSPGDAVLGAANRSGAAGNEFLEYVGLPAAGIYAYCVRGVAGTTGPGSTYRAGLVRNGGLYYPEYRYAITWLSASGRAEVGDTLSFGVAITNSSPLLIPGPVSQGVSWQPSCLSYLSADPAPGSISAGQITWPIRPGGLAPGEVWAAAVSLRAEKLCLDKLRGFYGLDYYFTGGGDQVPYRVALSVFLPVAVKP